MNVTPHLLSALAACVVVTGCVAVHGAMGGHVRAYDGPARPDAEVATLLSTRETSAPAVASIVGVDGENHGDNGLRGFPRTVKVLPGEHWVRLWCTVPGRYAQPAIHARFEAGRYYEFTCRDLGNGKAQAAVVDLGSSQPR